MAGKKDLIRLRKRKRRKQNIIRATIHFFVWAGVAVLYYIGFSVFFDTPVEYELKHSTDRLRREYTALVQRYDTLTTVMRNLSERDRNVFRILFESDPYDFDSEYERKQAAKRRGDVERADEHEHHAEAGKHMNGTMASMGASIPAIHSSMQNAHRLTISEATTA